MSLPPYTLIRSQRKTISMQVTREAQVLVRAPMHMNTQAIHAFVASHQQWLEKKLALLCKQAVCRKAFTFSAGQQLPFLGEWLTITAATQSSAVCAENGRLLIGAHTADPKQASERFLRAECARILPQRVREYAALLGVLPAGISITGAQTRWGSCSGKNRLCFSWRLICLPPELVDYVAAHECAHLREHNHSARFYALLAQALPDYREREKRLREWQALLPF